MKLLILGGTSFLGRHAVEAALGRGHEVTLFNRGRTNPDLFPGVERVRGDRDGGLAGLTGRVWNAVLDTCGYIPRIVRQSAEALRTSGCYCLVSTLSVYPNPGAPRLDETALVGTIPDPSVESVTAETYGPLKALCERAVESVFPGRCLIVRPGLLVGPHDPTNRFTYWVARVARGGEVLAPGRPERRVQFLDARDLAAWIVESLEGGRVGLFNANGPREPLTMQAFLESCTGMGRSRAELVWADDAFLVAHGVAPFTEMPLWIPGIDDHFDCARAFAAGLTCRPLEETLRDTLAWEQNLAETAPRRNGLSTKREAELLADWRRR